MTSTVDNAAGIADDIKIVHTPPTVQDGQLLLQMMLLDEQSGANDGFSVLSAFETPPTLAQLRKKHPRGSAEYRQVMAFVRSAETTGTFVRQGLLNETLVNDLYWIAGGWRLMEKVAKGLRRESAEPRMFENIEWLAKRAVEIGR